MVGWGQLAYVNLGLGDLFFDLVQLSTTTQHFWRVSRPFLRMSGSSWILTGDPSQVGAFCNYYTVTVKCVFWVMSV